LKGGVGRTIFLLTTVIIIGVVLVMGLRGLGELVTRVTDADLRNFELIYASAHRMDTLLAMNQYPDYDAIIPLKDAMMAVIYLKTARDRPLTIARSPYRTLLTRELMEQAMKVLQDRLPGKVKSEEIGVLENLELTCTTWRNLAQPGASKFNLDDDTLTTFYNALTEQTGGGGGLKIMSPIYITKTVSEAMDLLEAKYCPSCGEGNSNLEICGACWDIYQTNSQNPGNALTAMLDAGCETSCGMVCIALENSLSPYHLLLSSPDGGLKAGHLNAFITGGISFN